MRAVGMGLPLITVRCCNVTRVSRAMKLPLAKRKIRTAPWPSRVTRLPPSTTVSTSTAQVHGGGDRDGDRRGAAVEGEDTAPADRGVERAEAAAPGRPR